MGNSKIKIQDIISTLELLEINDFVLSLPEGLNTQLVGGNIHASISTTNK